jgi:hypothetical protein
MTLPELSELLQYLDVRLAARGDELEIDAPDGVLTDQIMAALRQHKAALIARVSGAARAQESQDEIPIFGRTSWRDQVGLWPIPWREAWGRLANAIEDETRNTDCPATWREAEQGAHALLAGRFRPEGDPQGALDAITKEMGWARIVLSGYTGDDIQHEPLTDAEAVAAIDCAFSDPAPARRSSRGPRDVRRGDRWLPWHYRLPPADRSKGV